MLSNKIGKYRKDTDTLTSRAPCVTETYIKIKINSTVLCGASNGFLKAFKVIKNLS